MQSPCAAAAAEPFAYPGIMRVRRLKDIAAGYA